MRSKENTVRRVRFICLAALIAAIYVVLTFFTITPFAGIQIRFAEMLIVLAFVMPAAVPGLTLGCLLSNIFTGCMLLDIIFGTLATFIGAMGAYLLGKIKNRKMARWLCTIPNIVSNTIIVSIVCYICYTPVSEQNISIIPFYAATIGIGEIISCGILGTVLLFSCEKTFKRLI